MSLGSRRFEFFDVASRHRAQAVTPPQPPVVPPVEGPEFVVRVGAPKPPRIERPTWRRPARPVRAWATAAETRSRAAARAGSSWRTTATASAGRAAATASARTPVRCAVLEATRSACAATAEVRDAAAEAPLAGRATGRTSARAAPWPSTAPSTARALVSVDDDARLLAFLGLPGPEDVPERGMLAGSRS